RCRAGCTRPPRAHEAARPALRWLPAGGLPAGRRPPAQSDPDRTPAADVPGLMHKVAITPSDEFSDRFPDHMCADLVVTLDDGTRLHASTDDYEGFVTNPLDWAGARRKFDALTSPFAEAELRDEIAELVHDLEHHPVRDLTEALARVPQTRSRRCGTQPETPAPAGGQPAPRRQSDDIVERRYHVERHRFRCVHELRSPRPPAGQAPHRRDDRDPRPLLLDLRHPTPAGRLRRRRAVGRRHQ